MTDVAPSFSLIQQESIQFNQPVSESSQTSIGALANALRQVILPVGSIIDSVLNQSTFQSQNGSATIRWIIADGRDVTGSEYQLLTGSTTVPDLRGIFRRGKNNGRADGNQNPDGDLAVGTFSGFAIQSHNHGFVDPGHSHTSLAVNSTGGPPLQNGVGFAVPAANTGVSQTHISIQAAGGNQTAPANVTVNTFIRIN